MIKRECAHLMFCRIHQERKSKEHVAFFHHSERRTIFSRVSKVIRDCIGFFFTSLCDQSRKIASASQPIRCKTKTNRDLVTRALGGLVTLTLSSHWLLKVFFFLRLAVVISLVLLYDTQSKSALSFCQLKRNDTEQKLAAVNSTHREFEMSSFLSIRRPSISSKYFLIGNLKKFLNELGLERSIVKFCQNTLKNKDNPHD